MNIRITGIDKGSEITEQGFGGVNFYQIYAEASWLDEHGKEQVVEFYTSVDEDDLLTDYRRAVTERAYEVITDYSITRQIMGEEWTVPDRPRDRKVMSA
jgi:hypothetical protein